MTAEKTTPWISRKLADEIYECAIADDGSVTVYAIQGPAGQGKTFLARDIGTRLGSVTGYEPARKGRIAWSGILDLYDPDTNSNRGLEQRLVQAFEGKNFEFDTYRTEREQYDTWFKSGVAGSSLEDQRRKVEVAFAQGLRDVSNRTRPILAFDTVERLEGASDPTQVELQNELKFSDDTASVMGWLIFQITQLNSGVVLLLGRRSLQFYLTLEKNLQQESAKRTGEIRYKNISLEDLDETELQEFFINRMEHYHPLEKLLTTDLRGLLIQKVGGSPLLLDLALQILLETSSPLSVQQALENAGGLQDLEGKLVAAYMNTFSDSNRHVLLHYLALARSGLFTELLKSIEPQCAPELVEELSEMEGLPFIKVRDISVTVPGTSQPSKRHTYFLHDAMYTICDRVLLRPEQVAHDSERLVQWYDQQLAECSLSPDLLLVESLFYRMRVNPQEGYQWYLQQADRAIRGAQTGLDMGLRDAMSLFLISATPEEVAHEQPGHSLSSPIDIANVKKHMPELFDEFRLDSGTLWIKRYTMRGKGERAEQIGKWISEWAEAFYQANSTRYVLAFTEFLLWYGQILMYASRTQDALAVYQQVLDLLTLAYPEGLGARAGKPDQFELWRYSLILGRMHNNLGYTYWMYCGKYTLAVQEFQKAFRLFRVAGLDEELANSNDNLGRVYALLGNEFQALQLIRNGLAMRRELKLTYRVALSENSLATTLSRFGDSAPALSMVQGALVNFRLAGIERGIGLGLITEGAAYRNLAETWREANIPLEEALRYTNLAEMDLRDAVRIFTTSVKEFIREVESCNEMACCYRARYFILTHMGAPVSEQEMAFTQGKLNFRRAIEAAQRYGYDIEELDSMQDIAVLMLRAGKYQEAEDYLKLIRERIPASHQIQLGKGLEPLTSEDRVDAYYKLMGQVELVEGALEFEQGKAGEELPPEKVILSVAQHYLFAVSYFNQYSGDVYAKRLTYGRIYKRFQNCPLELMHKITQEYLPGQVRQYNLPAELVRGLFEDVFGILDYGKNGL